jgi:Chaperone of endosialidase
MKIHRIVPVLLLVGVFGVAVAGGQEALEQPIPNWAAPATWSPARPHGGLTTMGEVTNPLPFIGVAPCRILDTRGGSWPFTGGIFAGGSDVRSYILAGVCGIPASARAVSLNFAVTGPGQTVPGFLTAWPTGGAIPSVSILNWDRPQEQIANAAVLPTSSSVSITVNVSAPTHVIMDVNGYYAGAGTGSFNTFLGLDAGNFTMSGDWNTAIGNLALTSDTTGSANTAIGRGALTLNTTGFGSTAIGYNALFSNTTGGTNTAIGFQALFGNGSGGFNTAVGYNALANSTGISNIGIGYSAGINQQTGSHDIYIGNAGVNGESNTIRIGDASFQDGGTIITGISGLSSIGGAPVYVNGGGRLGTSTSSSRRFKQAIRDIAEGSDGLMRLRPVAFKYKPEIDPTGLTQYGLIAEEVAEVFPDLVTSDRDGQPEGVRYHLITPLLLNEVQKQRRTAEAQEKRIEQQQETIDHEKAEIEGLRARLARLEAQLPARLRP